MIVSTLQGLWHASKFTCSSTVMAATAQRFHRAWASSTGAAAQQQASPVMDLTADEEQQLKTFHHLVRRPLAAAHNAAMLTALAASCRDLYVVMDQLHKKDILGIPHPLLYDPPAANNSSSLEQQDQHAEQQQQPTLNHTQMSYPVRDLTKLPDEVPPPGGWLRHHLSGRYMNRITAFAQLLPNHLEVSYQTGSSIHLWPAMEAYYPGFFDIDGFLRYLKPHFKIRRSKRPSNVSRVRCKLGWQRRKPYHKRTVIG